MAKSISAHIWGYRFFLDMGFVQEYRAYRAIYRK